MESFYCFEGEGLKVERDQPGPISNSNANNNSFQLGDISTPPAISDLDPSLEFSVDLQRLLEQTTQQGDQHQLFPELQHHSLLEETTVSGQVNFDDNTVIIENQSEETPMPNALQIVDSIEAGECPSLSEEIDYTTVKEEPESPFVHNLQGTVFKLPELLVESTVDLSTVSLASVSETTEEASPRKVGRPSSSSLKATPSSKTNRRRTLDKDSEEYKARRERNNIAVQKSRAKAKLKQRETEGKVKVLLDENEKLQKKVDLLTKELTVLKGLFANVGVLVPPEAAKYLKQ